MQRLPILTLASVAALGLAACGEDPNDNVTAIQDTPALSVNDLGPDTSVQLDQEQQARLDALDREAVSEEYDVNYETMWQESGRTPMSGTGDTGAMADTGTSTDAASEAGGTMSNTTGSATSTTSGMTMPPRGQMDFAFLDRNNNGQLSVAEYAIWAVGVNPTVPKENDQTRPYLRPEQINEAGQTFFYFDQDGDTYLSESEFQDARNSSRTP